jgi:hypothetical protein
MPIELLEDQDDFELELIIQFVPRIKHYMSVIKTYKSVLYRETVAVCSEIQAKHIKALYGQNVEFFNVRTWWCMK